jgi:peptidoglycan hydrolase CwlO-like protein
MDRTHYRMCSDSYLIETALYAPDAELAIVLAERLEEVQAENDERLEAARERADDFERDANRLDDKIYELQQEIETLELMISTRDETIEQLKEQKND